ncbi:MAG: PAS domain S-box protein [Rubrivivax sp.]|nr:PAS domain S-box protein [Rubrivivax sp.]
MATIPEDEARDLAAELDGDEPPRVPRQAQRQHLKSFWALLLGGSLLCATALFVVLFRLPGGSAIDHAAAVSTALADRLTAPDVGKPALDAELTRRLELLDHSLRQDDLDQAAFSEFSTRLRAARQAGADEPLRQMLPAAQELTGSIRAQLDARQQRAEGTIKVVTATLAGLLLLMIFGLVRHRRRLRRSIHRLSDELGQGADWENAVQALREDPAGPPSAFDALANGVAGVLRESDRRWQALAELSADWYWETDKQQRLTKVSGSIEVFTAQGWGAADLTGKRFDQLSFFKAPGIAGWGPLVTQLQGGERFREFECSVISRDRRSMRWVALSGRPRQDDGGAFIGFEGVARDVTERRRAMAKLRASEQRWSTVVRLATDWYWESDEQHRIQPMRMEQQHQGQFFADAVRGRTLWEAFPFGLDEMAWEMHRQDVEAQRPFRELELCVDSEDGNRHWLAISGLPRFNAAGGFRGYHGVARDISGHKEAERVLLRHNEELQRAVAARTNELQTINRDLEAFARQLAHELRTPIGHIQGLAQLLLNRRADDLSDEDRQLLELQLLSAGNMRDTVDALLNLARSTMQPMPTEVVDLSALAQEAIEGLAPLARTAPVRWTVQPGLRAVAAVAALKIVLSNLLGNAAKFTRRCENPQVDLRGHIDAEGTVHVIIEDNGIGFDPGKAERLFKPFGRLHTGEDYHGTGIGLTIVQRIIERHGGAVKAQPRSEGGARFEFSLPAQTPQILSVPEEIMA